MVPQGGRRAGTVEAGTDDAVAQSIGVDVDKNIGRRGAGTDEVVGIAGAGGDAEARGRIRESVGTLGVDRQPGKTVNASVEGITDNGRVIFAAAGPSDTHDRTAKVVEELAHHIDVQLRGKVHAQNHPIGGRKTPVRQAAGGAGRLGRDGEAYVFVVDPQQPVVGAVEGNESGVVVVVAEVIVGVGENAIAPRKDNVAIVLRGNDNVVECRVACQGRIGRGRQTSPAPAIPVGIKQFWV